MTRNKFHTKTLETRTSNQRKGLTKRLFGYSCIKPQLPPIFFPSTNEFRSWFQRCHHAACLQPQQPPCKIAEVFRASARGLVVFPCVFLETQVSAAPAGSMMFHAPWIASDGSDHGVSCLGTGRCTSIETKSFSLQRKASAKSE